MAEIIYTSHILVTDLITKDLIFARLQSEIDGLKKATVFIDPYSAAYLIKWEIEMPDYSLVREDF